jgi:hypothetical protein
MKNIKIIGLATLMLLSFAPAAKPMESSSSSGSSTSTSSSSSSSSSMLSSSIIIHDVPASSSSSSSSNSAAQQAKILAQSFVDWVKSRFSSSSSSSSSSSTDLNASVIIHPDAPSSSSTSVVVDKAYQLGQSALGLAKSAYNSTCNGVCNAYNSASGWVKSKVGSSSSSSSSSSSPTSYKVNSPRDGVEYTLTPEQFNQYFNLLKKERYEEKVIALSNLKELRKLFDDAKSYVEAIKEFNLEGEEEAVKNPTLVKQDLLVKKDELLSAINASLKTFDFHEFDITKGRGSSLEKIDRKIALLNFAIDLSERNLDKFLFDTVMTVAKDALNALKSKK